MNQILLKSVKDSRVTLLAGALSGAIFGIEPIAASIFLFALIVIVFLYVYKDHAGEKKKKEITEVEKNKLLHSDSNALEVAKNSNLNLLVVGNLIELVVHPNINSAVDIRRSGWDPQEIIVNYDSEEFDVDELIDMAGGIKKVLPPDGVKYCLVNTPFVTEESPTIVLELQQTKYSIIETARDLVKENNNLIGEYPNIVLEENKLPTSFCLHFIVRLRKGKILCMKRARRMAYYPNYWSMTGEEQFSDIDLENGNPIDYLFKRALCEELLHSRNVNDTALSLVDDKINFLRILSLGVEWPDINPALFGVAQLNVDENELREFLKDQKAGLFSSGDEDREGSFSTITPSDAIKLLEFGECPGKELFSQNSIVLTSDKLHPTSRYRIYRLLRSIKRSSLVK